SRTFKQYTPNSTHAQQFSHGSDVRLLATNVATIGEDTNKNVHVFDIDVLKIAISADVELPFKLSNTLDKLDEYRKNGQVILYETMHFSAIAGRQTQAHFGTSVNDIKGVVERNGVKTKISNQVQIGTNVVITIDDSGDSLTADFNYQSMRIAGEQKEDEPMKFFKCQLMTKLELNAGEPKLLIARAEADRRFVMLSVTPR
ncbi:MAG: hypothetical protein KDB03_26610, partial [Planctomycetales bacterium]|nr:hypothetical protein [Planctomycetales bacterium]